MTTEEAVEGPSFWFGLPQSVRSPRTQSVVTVVHFDVPFAFYCGQGNGQVARTSVLEGL